MPVSFCKMTGDNLSFPELPRVFFLILFYFIDLLRYKNDPWLWDLEWDVQEFKLKKMAAGKKRASKQVVETPAVPALLEQEEGTIPAAAAAATTTNKNEEKRLKLADMLPDPGPPSEEETVGSCPSRLAVEKLKETVSRLPKRRQHLPGHPR